MSRLCGLEARFVVRRSALQSVAVCPEHLSATVDAALALERGGVRVLEAVRPSACESVGFAAAIPPPLFVEVEPMDATARRQVSGWLRALGAGRA